MKRFLSFSATLLLIAACTSPKVQWFEGPGDEHGKAVHKIVLTDMPGGSRVWFQKLYDNPEVLEGPAIKHYQGTSFYIDVPAEAGKTITIEYKGRALPRYSWAPEGFILQQKDRKDKLLEVSYEFFEKDYTVLPEEWFACGYDVKPTDIIPQVKRVYGPGDAHSDELHAVKGWYRITFDENGTPNVEANDEEGAKYADVTLKRLENEGVKNCIVEDWPDMEYRGLMLDVVRDFRTKDEVLRILDLMSAYKLNRLHFHIGDDEAWCLEIPEIPELTEFSGNHELPSWDLEETNALKPTNNGKIGLKTFYTEKEYKEILAYAWEKGIAVIPEFDAPGHSRSSIKAMQYYERKTGDDSYRLQDPDDTSHYWSAQDFNDNAISPWLPGVYRFYDTVFGSVVKMHEEAGAPLYAIHIGGDEVPSGVWSGKDRKAMKNLFTEGMLDIAEKHGVKLAGWHDMAIGLEPATLERLKKNLYFVNVWSRHEKIELAYKLANDGIPVLLCNVNNTYIDLAYGDDPHDIGLHWGGYVDERKSFALQPWKIYESCRWKGINEALDVYGAAEGKTQLERPEMVIGVQANLWSEIVRSIDDATYQILPKALGVFERGWNSSPCWPTDEAFFEDFDKFYSIISAHEMPWWKEAGYNYKER